jgi:hypothetical protein
MMHHCNNCNNNFSGKFCNQCGQKLFLEESKSLKNLFEEGFHFLTHFEGKLFTSLKAIFFNPAKITIDYCNGIRTRYYKPISLFLYMVILYLLFPMFSGLNMEMKYYKSNFIGGSIMSKQIAEKSAEFNISEKELATKFKEKSEKISKFCFFLLLPLTTILFYFLYPNKKIKLYDNVILSTEINIFYITTYFLLLPAIIYPMVKIGHFDFSDKYFIPFVLISFNIYLYFIVKNFFKSTFYVNIIKSTLITLLYFFLIISIYKFFVFEATFLLL